GRGGRRTDRGKRPGIHQELKEARPVPLTDSSASARWRRTAPTERWERHVALMLHTPRKRHSACDLRGHDTASVPPIAMEREGRITRVARRRATPGQR